MGEAAGVQVRPCQRNADREVSVPPDLDDLLTALYVYVVDSLPPRRGPGRRPQTTDAEIICLAVAQVLLDCPCDRRFLAVAGWRLPPLLSPPPHPPPPPRLRTLPPPPPLLLGLSPLHPLPPRRNAVRLRARRRQPAGTARRRRAA